MRLELVIAVVGTGLLVWAAVEDIRQRKIPVAAGFGMLLLGLAVLIWQSWYIWAAYFAVAVWCTRGGPWRYVLVGASLAVLWLYTWEAVPMVVGVLFVSTLFWMKWFGGGDAQLAMGLVGIGHDWLVIAIIFGLTIVVGIVLTIVRRGGVVEGTKRLAWVARHLSEPADAGAIRTPWAIVAAVGGVTYLWLWALVL
jgi:Flp pilus assembly protein protease CpaA